MNFETIYYEDIKTFLDITFSVGPIMLIIAFFFLATAMSAEGLKRTVSTIMSYVLVIPPVVAVIIVLIWQPQEINREAFENNLKQKYDITSIVDDNPLYKVNLRKSGEQLILVENEDEKQGAFFLTQNMDTFEPTLHELTNNDNGGSLTLEDITK